MSEPGEEKQERHTWKASRENTHLVRMAGRAHGKGRVSWSSCDTLPFLRDVRARCDLIAFTPTPLCPGTGPVPWTLKGALRDAEVIVGEKKALTLQRSATLLAVARTPRYDYAHTLYRQPCVRDIGDFSHVQRYHGYSVRVVAEENALELEEGN